MPTEKFTKADLQKAVDRLSMLEFFPSNPAASSAIMSLLVDMCPSKVALTWLIDTMVNRVGKWHGPTELRGVLCWKYPPADGIDATCSIPGFTPADGEAKSFDQHQQLKAGGWLSKDDEMRQLLGKVANRKQLQ